MARKLRSYFLLLLLTLLWPWTLSAQSMMTSRKYRKSIPYQAQQIPHFADVREQLPEPVIQDNAEWITLYWFCWEQAFSHIKAPPKGSPLVAYFIDEAFNDNIFQWDTHFMILFWKYAHHIFPAIRSHDNFYITQDHDGYICREIQEANGRDFVYQGREHTINPPLFAWVELEYYQFNGDLERLRTVLPALEAYGNWIEENRKHAGAPHQLYWQTNLGSGMDNSPRSGSGWVDLSAQMALHYEALAKIAISIREVEKFKQFMAKRKEIMDHMNQYMWDKEDHFYYDVDADGKCIPVKTIASFWPLLARIPMKQQAEQMIFYLQTPHFARVTPIPTLSAKHAEYHKDGGYWKGGVWAPTNYMVLEGLRHYHQGALAANLASQYLTSMHEVYLKTGTVWENYMPDSLKPGNPAKPDFVGWTGLGPITMLIEHVIGIKVYGEADQILWSINRTDRHGIRNLHMKDATISMIAAPRTSNDAPVTINVQTDKPFTLVLQKGLHQMKTFQINEGKQRIVY